MIFQHTSRCNCNPPKGYILINRHKVCPSCQLRIQGKPQNQLTRLAAERNWNKLQIKGAVGQLLHVANKLQQRRLAADIAALEPRLLAINDRNWNEQKELLREKQK